MPFLPAMAAYLSDGHAIYSDTGQSFFHVIQFEGLNDRFEVFHSHASRL